MNFRISSLIKKKSLLWFWLEFNWIPQISLGAIAILTCWVFQPINPPFLSIYWGLPWFLSAMFCNFQCPVFVHLSLNCSLGISLLSALLNDILKISNYFLLIFKNAINFCILILSYSATFLKLLITSNSLFSQVSSDFLHKQLCQL